MNSGIQPKSTPSNIFETLDTLETKLNNVIELDKFEKKDPNQHFYATFANKGSEMAYKYTPNKSWFSSALDFLSELISSKLDSKKNYVTVKFKDDAKTYILTKMVKDFRELSQTFLEIADKPLGEQQITKLKSSNLNDIEEKIKTIDGRITDLYTKIKDTQLSLSESDSEKIKFLAKTELLKSSWEVSKGVIDEKLATFKRLNEQISYCKLNMNKDPGLKNNLINFKRLQTNLNAIEESLDSDEVKENLNAELIQDLKNHIKDQKITLIKQIHENFKTHLNQIQSFEQLNEINNEYREINSALTQFFPEEKDPQIQNEWQSIQSSWNDKLKAFKKYVEQDIKANRDALKPLESQEKAILKKQNVQIDKLEGPKSIISVLLEDPNNDRNNPIPGISSEQAQAMQIPDTLNLLEQVLFNKDTEKTRELAKKLSLPDFQNDSLAFYTALESKLKQLDKDTTQIHENRNNQIRDYENKVAHASKNLEALKKNSKHIKAAWRAGLNESLNQLEKQKITKENSKLNESAFSTFIEKRNLTLATLKKLSEEIEHNEKFKKEKLQEIINHLEVMDSYVKTYSESSDVLRDFVASILDSLFLHNISMSNIFASKATNTMAEWLEIYADYAAGTLPNEITAVITGRNHRMSIASLEEKIEKLKKELPDTPISMQFRRIPTIEEVNEYIKKQRGKTVPDKTVISKASALHKALNQLELRKAYEKNLQDREQWNQNIQQWERTKLILSEGKNAISHLIELEKDKPMREQIENKKITIKEEHEKLLTQQKKLAEHIDEYEKNAIKLLSAQMNEIVKNMQSLLNNDV